MFDFFDISCKKASRLLSESQDHSLSFFQRFQLQAHLKVCDACAQVQKQFTAVHKVFAQYSKLAGQVPPAPGREISLSPEVRARIKASLK